MKNFDEKNATSDELYEWCIKEYKNKNSIIKILIKNFFHVLENIFIDIKNELNNVLEIGCGAGESTLRIKQILPDVKYDASEYDIRYIEAIEKRDIPLKVFQEDVYDIKKSDNSYDCIIMLEVLEHLENIEKAVSELFRVSKKYILISVPNEPIWRICNLIRGKYLLSLGNTPGHINHFNRKKLKKILSPYAAKLTIKSAFPWLIILAEKNEKKEH